MTAGPHGAQRRQSGPRVRQGRRWSWRLATLAGTIGLSVTVIWAVTGASYYWPGWVWLGLSIPFGVVGGIRLALRAPNRRGLAVQFAVSVVVVGICLWVWLMAGPDYPWPIWPLLGLTVGLAAHALLFPPRGSNREQALEARVGTLTQSRRNVLEIQELELRRVERDLHDGAQARLVSLGMSLGLAEQLLQTKPDEAQQLLADARTTAGEALSDLRDLVRGIHPPVLADRGLEGAVRALVVTVPIPVEVTIHLPPGGLAEPVESALYFAVAESIANIVKHSDGKHGVDPGRAHARDVVGGHRGRRLRRSRPRRRNRTCGSGPPAGRLRRHLERGQPPGRANHPASGDSVRAVIAEDLALLRDGLVRVMAAHGIEVVEAVQDGPSVVRALVAHRPDIAVLDVRLPPTFTNEGLVAAIEARQQVPNLPVLVLSQYVEPLYARELLSSRAGRVGYLLKDRVMDVGQFVEAIHRVAAGGTVMDPEVVSRLVMSRARDDTVRSLTPREREVLKLMAEGRSNAAIAGALVVSEKAVSKHIANIFLKLGLPPSDDDNRRVMAVLAFLNA